MTIGYPKYKIKDRAWFMSKNSQLVYGMVTLLTIAIREFDSNIWYSFVDQLGNQYTVEEKDVLDVGYTMPLPKYRVGEEVEYEYLTTSKEQVITVGTITRVEVGIFDKEGTSEIAYYLQDDPDFWVIEDEILGVVGTTLQAADAALNDGYGGV